MSGVELPGLIIASVTITAQIAKKCGQYTLDVKDAKDDAGRLKSEVEELQNVLRECDVLLKSAKHETIAASSALLEAVKRSNIQLEELDKKLEGGKTRKAMGRVGWRALKWPLKRSQLDKTIQELERCKSSITLALQVDQT